MSTKATLLLITPRRIYAGEPFRETSNETPWVSHRPLCAPWPYIIRAAASSVNRVTMGTIFVDETLVLVGLDVGGAMGVPVGELVGELVVVLVAFEE